MSGLFRNTLASSVPRLAGYAFSLLLAPLMIERLGLAAFGVWAVTGGLAQYAGLLDLGLARALSRYVALYDARDDRRAMAETLGLGMIVAAVLAVLSVGAALLAAPVLADALDVASAQDMRIVLVSAVVIMAAATFASVISATPVGMRRMVAPSAATFAGTVLNFVVSVGVLLASTELTDYAVANAAAGIAGALFSVVAHVVVCRRVEIALPSRARTREIIGYSLKGQVIWLAALVNQQTDKVIIGVLLGPRAAGAFEIANRVVLAVQSFGILTLGAMVPTATAAIVERGRTVIADFYGRYTTRSVAIAYPMFGLACVGAPFLLVAWLGEAPEDSALILVVLSLAFGFNVTTGVGMTLAMSDGRAGLVARTAVLTAVLNVVLTLALAPAFGLWGILLGTVLAEVLGSTAQMAVFHRTYRMPWGDLLRAAGPPGLLTLALGAPFAVWYAAAGTETADRLSATAALALVSALYGGAYWLIASRAGWLPERLALPFVRRTQAARSSA